MDVELRKVQPPQYLYHGTAARFLDVIRADGIKKMNRQYVHLSLDYQTAVAVGRRHGSPVVVLRIDAGVMEQNGVAFYRAKNGVWLCDYVSPEYFLHSGGWVKRGHKSKHKCPSGHLTFSK